MIGDEKLGDAAVREARVSRDVTNSTVLEVEAYCRAPIRQPLANVYVIDLIGEGHVRFQIKGNSGGAPEPAILVVEADLDVVEVVPVGGENSLDRSNGSDRLAVSVCRQRELQQRRGAGRNRTDRLLRFPPPAWRDCRDQ